MDEIQAQAIPVPPVEILRHRAAIRRTELSRPLKCLFRDNLLNSNTTFFDYGCGYGDDLEAVRNSGLSASGWVVVVLVMRWRLYSDGGCGQGETRCNVSQ